ncbi:glutamate receptor ionotropic, kainate 3-like [Macrobrachium nipponense]|uniref:glutamate receptor ionotropic, kainate 3-like n=1 Tax=Macrobrachium nipponense TaxID=159736 RepID=UPI0030C7E550
MNWENVTGCLNLTVAEEASMSANVYSISHARSKVLDFSSPVFLDDQTIAYMRPHFVPQIDSFVKPFEFRGWVAIFLAILLVYVVIVAVQFGHNKVIMSSDLPESEKKKLYNPIGFKHWLWSFTGLIDQDIRWQPAGLPVRAIGGFWILMGAVISILYRSTLRAMLITPKIVLPFTDFRSLAATDIKIWAPLGSRFNEALNLAEPGSKLAGVRKNIIMTRNITEGPEGLFNETWGVVDVRKAILYYVHRDFSRRAYCNYYIINDGVLRTTSLAFGFPKGSTLRPKVDKILRNLRAFGIINHLFSIRIRNATQCLKPLDVDFATLLRPMAVKDYYGVYVIFFTGIVLSTLSFLLEWLVYAALGRRRKKCAFVKKMLH